MSKCVINEDPENTENGDNKVSVLSEIVKSPAKKRGRKPKGGKIVEPVIFQMNKEIKSNVMLHLKCRIADLYNNPLEDTNIQGYNLIDKNEPHNYEILDQTKQSGNSKPTTNDVINDDQNSTLDETEPNIKETWKKLKLLQHELHNDIIQDKKSACFWCTYDFDNPTIYIPKHFIKDTYHVYGCFCSPECAAAHLMNENIDSSSKFERYHLINHVYSKIYNYTKNIKPAPNPYYILDKYYGNLTIQEYRSLFKNDRLFLIIDKPLTRILPELHEDNDDFIINKKLIPSNSYKNKQVKNKKSEILNEKFGLV